jgi:hypothetical protein
MKLLPGIQQGWPFNIVTECIRAPAFLYNGVRKIVQGITVEFDQLPELTYSDLGYTQNKHKQLVRNYFDPEECDRVKALIHKRRGQTFTSVAMSMRAGAKDKRSMGHCIQTLIIGMCKDKLTVELQYRSTEVILKYGGDLAFLPWVFEQLDIEPQKVSFRFANAYLSGVFFPTLMRFWDPIDLMDYIFEKDPMLFKGATRFVLRSAREKDQHFPYSPENRQHQIGWEALDMPKIARYLEKKHKKYGRPLPTIHKRKEDYETRSQKRLRLEEED